MAFVHVLSSGGVPNYELITHAAIPSGNNSVGTPWKTCWLASFGAGKPSSWLLVGNGPGQISQTESNQISSGDLLELGPFLFTDEPWFTVDDRNASIDAVASQMTNMALGDFMLRFKYYGFTRP